MKHVFRLFLATLLLSCLLIRGSHAHEHPVEDLLELPHPMRAIHHEAFAKRLNDEQKAGIDALRGEIQPRFQALMREALPLQEKLRSAIVDRGITIDETELQQELQHLAEVRLQMTRVIASAYTRLRVILGDEDWQALLQALKQD